MERVSHDLSEPCVEVFTWSVLVVLSCRRGDSVPEYQGSKVGRGVSKIEIALGDIKLSFYLIVIKAFVKGAQTGVHMPIQWDMKNLRLYFLKLPSTSPVVHLPPQQTRNTWLSRCGLLQESYFFLEPSRETVWTLWSLSQISDPQAAVKLLLLGGHLEGMSSGSFVEG